MPRGVKVVKTDEEILQEIEKDISEFKDRIARLNDKISELETQKQAKLQDIKRKKVDSLIDIVDQSGLSPEQIKELISNATKGEVVNS